MSAATDLLDRLFARLEDAARQEASSHLTIADLYQRLIPYRAVRSELGILELAEYEHALVRLLAGEGGHLSIDSAEARNDLARELASPNPILGVYRDYPDVAVRFAARSEVEVEREVDEPVAEPLPVLEAAPAPARCVRCALPLPAVAGLRYCPSCGADQREIPCAGCGATLRPEWNFCIRCGTARAPVPAEG